MSAKAKGSGFELEVQRRLEDAGLTASRVAAQAGMHGDAHDIVAIMRGQGVKLECKRRGDGFREMYRWLQQADAVISRADRKPALITLPLDTFLHLIGGGDADAKS